MVFLDINPVSKGHCLYVPKKHYENVYEIPEDEIKFMKKLPYIASKLAKITGATGLNIMQNNGTDAGQVVKHYHIHLIPRFPNDNLLHFPPQHELDKSEAEELVKLFNQN